MPRKCVKRKKKLKFQGVFLCVHAKGIRKYRRLWDIYLNYKTNQKNVLYFLFRPHQHGKLIKTGKCCFNFCFKYTHAKRLYYVFSLMRITISFNMMYWLLNTIYHYDIIMLKGFKLIFLFVFSWSEFLYANYNIIIVCPK